jgi:hypothetical protein
VHKGDNNNNNNDKVQTIQHRPTAALHEPRTVTAEQAATLHTLETFVIRICEYRCIVVITSNSVKLKAGLTQTMTVAVNVVTHNCG